MHNILYIPLDERTCNYKYPSMLAEMTDDINLIIPPAEIMGSYKKPADTEKIWLWIFENTKKCEYAIISLDTLFYGNIINSRTHYKTISDCDNTFENIKKIKDINPQINIQAFNLVARVAKINSSTEDPDYWEKYGEKIWLYSYLLDKINRKKASETDKTEFETVKNEIPEKYLNDFLNRRSIDIYVNLKALDFVKNGIINNLVIPKDDTAPYGYAAIDQKNIAEKIYREKIMDKVMVYPGADEVGCVLFARVFGMIKNYTPKIIIKYSSVNGGNFIPICEDRPFHEGLKSQINSVGGIIVNSEENSDILVAVNSPGTDMYDSLSYEKDVTYYSYSNNTELINYINYYTDYYKKACSVSDVKFLNGGDSEFIETMILKNSINSITSYCGWNTAQNTDGIAISHSVISSYYRNFISDKDMYIKSKIFLLRMLIEGWIFETNILKKIYSDKNNFKNTDPYNIEKNYNEVGNILEKLIKEEIHSNLNDTFAGRKIVFKNLSFPWKRVFDIDFDLELI
ncbi:MAG: DUF4127 family protein [Thermotogae bacterium]|nr:DUF4127 family protein [Thermotogota bacterium]